MSGEGFVIGLARRAWESWCAFWFESNKPLQLRLFRICFGVLAFLYYAHRTLDLELYYSSAGIMPLSVVNELLPMEFRWSILFHLTSTPMLWALHLTSLAAIFALTIGFYPRVAALVAYVLHVSFMHRNMSPSYGVDLISTFFLLYLVFVNTKKQRSFPSSIATRMIQMQVCIIYAYSGLEKARGMQWWGGEALWGVFANSQLMRFDASFMAQFPLAIVAITYATLAWEIYFPALVWVRGIVRNSMLLGGVALHLGIGLFVNIPFFGMLMIVSYIVFFDDELIKKIESRFPLIARAG